MQFFKSVIVITATALLMACSSGPSDSDINVAIKAQMSQMDAALAPMGFKASDVLDFDIKIKNKSKQDDGRWLVETETTVKAKKSLKDFNEDQQMGLGMMFGKFEKGGQIGQAQMGTAHMSKGDNGWILTN